MSVAISSFQIYRSQTRQTRQSSEGAFNPLEFEVKCKQLHADCMQQENK